MKIFVYGKVYDIDEKVLKQIDDLEAKGFLYNRKNVIVELNGIHTTVYTYVYKLFVDKKKKLCKEW